MSAHYARLVRWRDAGACREGYSLQGLFGDDVQALLKERDELLEALLSVTPLMIPGMNWTDEIGQLVKQMVLTALTKATGEQS